MADFTWIGNSVGVWTTATNWDDLTTGKDPSNVVPGAGDTVTFTGDTLYGAGAAKILTVSSTSALAGTFSVSTLVSLGNLLVDAGGTLDAVSATVNSYLDIDGYAQISTLSLYSNGEYDGGGIETSGTLNLLFNTLQTSADFNIGVGDTAAIDLGGSNDTPGYFSVDPNAVLVLSLTSVAFFYSIDAPMLEINGRLKAGGLFIDSNQGFGGLPSLSETLVGSGTLEVLPHGEIAVGAVVDSSSLTFQMDQGSLLQFRYIDGGGPTIVMSGNGTLDFSGELSFYISDYFATPAISDSTEVFMQGSDNEVGLGVNGLGDVEGMTISGFNGSDDIRIAGQSITSIGVSTTFDTLTVNITIYHGAVDAGTIVLEGDYEGDTFGLFGNIITVTEPSPPGKAVTLSPLEPTTTIARPINTYGLVGVYGASAQSVGAALFGAPGTDFTIQNLAFIESDTTNSFAAGIVLGAAGTITNAGTIIGANGISVFDIGKTSGAYVENRSTIEATISNGIYLQANGSAINTGALTASAIGLQLAGGGYAYNSGAITAATGIDIQSGKGSYAYNRGVISAVGDGIILAAPGYISNVGTIDSEAAGISLLANASAYNSGTIKAVVGIALAAGGTVTDLGVITGIGKYAVSFASDSGNVFILSPTAKTTGIVTGGGGNLELQADRTAVGTASVNQFIDFKRITLEKGATWDFAGTDSVGAAMIVNDGTIKEGATDKVVINGTLDGSGLVDLSKNGMTLESAVAGTEKIKFTGTSETLTLADVAGFAGKVEAFKIGDAIDLETVSLTSITGTHFSSGVLTLTEAGGAIHITFSSPAAFSTDTFALTTGGNGIDITLVKPAKMSILAPAIVRAPLALHFAQLPRETAQSIMINPISQTATPSGWPGQDLPHETDLLSSFTLHV